MTELTKPTQPLVLSVLSVLSGLPTPDLHADLDAELWKEPS